MSSLSPYMTVEQVAEELGLRVAAVEDLLQSKRLPAVQPPDREPLVSRLAFDAYLRRRNGVVPTPLGRTPHEP